MTERAPRSSLSLAQARRIAIAAQGLAKGKPAAPASSRAISKTFERLQLVQIDSVNVLSRSHYLPFFARLGNYDRAALDRLSQQHPRKMVEYWAHEASFIKPEHFADLLPWQRRNWFGDDSRAGIEERELARRVQQLLSSSNPLTSRQISHKLGDQSRAAQENWGWNWTPVKLVLERLFMSGQLSVAGRNEQFERRYTSVQRVYRQLPQSPAESQGALKRLIEASARAHGIGTVRCFADYFRLPVKAALSAVGELEQEGVLEAVQVAGWKAPLYLHREAAVPRISRGRALLSPFDSLVFERRRLLDLFGFHYRIGIYTPAEKRTHGYYVLPFLLGDRLVARTDLKADRLGRRLLVRTAFAEAEAPVETARELAAELQLMARWLQLDDVVVEPVGDLAGELAREVAQLN
ncbi:winged helix-turn-helix domain-containing protein [Psychromicrobium sp. YIM B11713]|uniref:winged helix-turn-helix domain-containing protein n=1 Tax=Psychromicrobium sp. YIM B11713 TaxID=3145233 RepID=UPI00374E4CE7